MSINQKSPRDHLTEFIELYRSFPCLWKVKNKDYSDRSKRDMAYTELVKKYKEIDTTADRNAVVKKINSLRTVYKKELTKLKNSMKSGSGTEDVYRPSLWYFSLLQFLDDQETSRPSRSKMDEDGVKEGPEDTGVMDLDADEATADKQGLKTPATTSRNISRPLVMRPVRKRQLNDIEEAAADPLHLVGKKLEAVKPDDPFDIFGKHVADRLRKIKPDQIKFAHKLISDVLFEADMESLNRNCKIVGTLE